jgi:hypothetical protein
MCSSSPAVHHCKRQEPPTVCIGPAKHHRRSDALMQPARAYGPSIAGAPPQHPNTGGACHPAIGGKLRITPPACGLLSKRGAGSQQTNPLVYKQHGLSPQAGRNTTTALCLDPASALQRPPPGAWLAQAQLQPAQHHPFTTTGPLRR